MNKLFTWVLLALFCMASMTACNRDHDMGVQPESRLVSKNTTPRLYAIKQVGVATKAVSVKGKTWEPGATIRIKFLNGSGAIQSKVQQYAALWLEHANVKFEYVATSQEADVKIGFEWGNEDDLPFIAWSTTGTDARLVPQTEASLNFVGLEDDLSDEVFIKGEVLQAFGRILGLGFEHQAPQSPIVFKASSNTDKKKLEGYFGMSREQIMEQIIPLYTEAQSNHTEYDPTSIMALFLPKTILVSPENSVENNTELSELDKTFIAQLYPKVWLKHITNQSFTSAVEANGKIYLSGSYSIYSMDQNQNIKFEFRANGCDVQMLGVNNHTVYCNVQGKVYYIDEASHTLKPTNIPYAEGSIKGISLNGVFYVMIANKVPNETGLYYSTSDGNFLKVETPIPSADLNYGPKVLFKGVSMIVRQGVLYTTFNLYRPDEPSWGLMPSLIGFLNAENKITKIGIVDHYKLQNTDMFIGKADVIYFYGNNHLGSLDIDNKIQHTLYSNCTSHYVSANGIVFLKGLKFGYLENSTLIEISFPKPSTAYNNGRPDMQPYYTSNKGNFACARFELDGKNTFDNNEWWIYYNPLNTPSDFKVILQESSSKGILYSVIDALNGKTYLLTAGGIYEFLE